MPSHHHHNAQDPMQAQATPQYSEQDAHAVLGDYQQRWAAPPQQLRPLPAPVCLPQVAVEGSAAFARGYNEQMMASGISMADWLRFIDGLNNAMVCITAAASPRLLRCSPHMRLGWLAPAAHCCQGWQGSQVRLHAVPPAAHRRGRSAPAIISGTTCE
jgi:hypothetical protein